MATTKNCRNCGFAEWHRNRAGAKLYGNWAACTATVDLVRIVPASLLTGISGHTLRALGEKTRAVASNGKAPLDCPFWKPEEK